MKKTKLIPYFLAAFFCIYALNAQIEREIGEGDRTGNLFFGFGFNIVEDNGNLFGNTTGPSLNFSNPYNFYVEYNVNNKISIFGNLSFNKYVAGKSIDSRIVLKGSKASYVAFDIGSHFYFRKKLDNYTFEPYFSFGMGYTNIGTYKSFYVGSTKVYEPPAIGRLTINAGFGANYWFSSEWGMNVNLMGKIGLGSDRFKTKYNYDYVSNQIQFSFGVVYSTEIND